MLAHRFLGGRKQLWHAACNCAPVRYVQNASEPSQALDTINIEMRMPAPIAQLPQRQPFAKNLFLGILDNEFMYFSEPQSKERHTQFFEWLQPIEKYMAECMEDPQSVRRNDVLSHLRDLGVFRANVSEKHLGLSLNQTELTKLVEVLSCLPWLGSYMVKNHIAPIHIINLLATEEQKAKYMPRIITGELVPVLCYTESESGLNLHTNMTSVLDSDCNTFYVINGEKSYVSNGQDANLYVVFATYGNPNSISSHHNPLSVFLVERDSGIVCKDVKNLVGLRGNPVCTVTFKDVKIPKENLLGKIRAGTDVLVNFLSPGSRNIAPQAVGLLRTFMRILTRNILQRKHLDKNCHEFEGVQEIIGKIAIALYAMESTLYFTTGMMDLYENQDCSLEKAMTEVFCATECVARVYDGLQIIGAQSYLRENPYIQILEDALSYTLFDGCNMDSNTYIALLGLQHTGKHMRDHIFKLRNPYTFPLYTLFAGTREPRLRLRIMDHLHPSLISGAEIAEKCLARLQTASVVMLQRHAVQAPERQMELRRLSKIATRTFALLAVLSRCSRSYCIGLRNNESDRFVAGGFSLQTLDLVRNLSDELDKEDLNNGDELNRNIAEVMFNKKDYFAEHPLSRTY
ncbi:acyl-CoA dehydrogenase family member 9, mitochondrial [Pseudomyrmex gracilis]|uniref:acyl-CoA dehydrogenase family member 9, mitochondrial n=1 Tax=Pseudomyrmex gracilis TaxID=219809 RepID=UPI0009951EFB|nr:acyl-CoA dehydrogenase family member 9, mitochondrial [Pseudomyrmex gracilis]